MKVGTHGGEDFAAIVERKSREIETSGVTYWGYGGSVCHPLTQVQPFAAASNDEIYLVGVPTPSVPGLDPTRAEEMSPDKVHWEHLPAGNVVLASKYALVLSDLRIVDGLIDLECYEVAVGAKAGLSATEYVRGRVDKACVRRKPMTAGAPSSSSSASVSIVGALAKPYAVFLR